MKTIKKDLFLEIMDRAEIDNDALNDSYGGRGMYNRTCPGITVENQTVLFRFFAAAGQIEAEQEEDDESFPDGPEFDSFDLAKGVATDSMYRGMIFYWPYLTLED